VTFVDTTTGSTIGTGALSGGSTQATVGVPAAGLQTIAAIYSGDAHYIASAATSVQRVSYDFGGFLAPLNKSLSYALGRTVPIKFQFTDFNGQSITSLSAIVSLQVPNAGGTNVMSNAGHTALRYDPTANQFVANWRSKGLAVGSYAIRLDLADGTVQTKTVTLSAGGASAGLMADGTTAGQATAGALQGGDVALYVDNSSGLLTSDELARIDDAVAAVHAVLAP
jgi:hypothetical protein